MYRYNKASMFIFVFVVCLSITSYGQSADSVTQFVKKANWLGKHENDIYLLHKQSGGQEKSFEEVFSSFADFKEVTWIKIMEGKYITVEARGLIHDPKEMTTIADELLGQDEDWVLKSPLSRIPANPKINKKHLIEVLNKVKNKKLSYIFIAKFLPDLKKNKARILYFGGALADTGGNIIYSEMRVKNYNLTLEKKNFYRNIRYTNVRTSLAEMILFQDEK